MWLMTCIPQLVTQDSAVGRGQLRPKFTLKTHGLCENSGIIEQRMQNSRTWPCWDPTAEVASGTMVADSWDEGFDISGLISMPASSVFWKKKNSVQTSGKNGVVNKISFKMLSFSLFFWLFFIDKLWTTVSLCTGCLAEIWLTSDLVWLENWA